MQFYDYESTFHLVRRETNSKSDIDHFYAERLIEARMNKERTIWNQLMAEHQWLKNHRPYYQVYPRIIPAFLRLKLNIDSAQIQSPHDVLLIRLPKERLPQLSFEQDSKVYCVQTMLVVNSTINNTAGISIWIDIGEKWQDEIPFYTYRNFQCVAGLTIEEALSNLPNDAKSLVGVIMPEDIVINVVRLCCTLCLLADNEEIIEPDVLDADRGKWLATHDPKYIERAHKRNKVGWNIGNFSQVSPHYRNPHPALVWYGEGKRQKKIILRKGSVIHKEIVRQIPTGYEDLKNKE